MEFQMGRILPMFARRMALEAKMVEELEREAPYLRLLLLLRQL